MNTNMSRYQLRHRPPNSGRKLFEPVIERFQAMIDTADAMVEAPFTGITTDGTAIPGLFSISPTGVSTAPIKTAVESFLDALGPERDRASFPVDSDAWQRWCNIHPYLMRHGVLLDEMTPDLRDKALAVMESAFSERGYKEARDVMRLNETLLEMTEKPEEFGEWLYWLSVFGTPSESEPWGWQMDGHHLNVNCFILGDQLTMTPFFFGSEPTLADVGKYAGTRVFEAEEQKALALMASLTPEQRTKAIVSPELPMELFAAAFRDNMELQYEGIAASELSSAQQGQLLDLVEVYIGRTNPGHAAVKMAEVRAHIDATHFSWRGGFNADSVFYYRVHSPVILIEFDHQRGIEFANDEPERSHIHTVVRTPNGNDYGKDLLRQHYENGHHAVK